MQMRRPEFVNRVFQIAQAEGYSVALNRLGLRQIDFGHKKLHEAHLEQLYPSALAPGARISKLIEEVAPGRPCAHKPMKQIIERLTAARNHQQS